ncbi:MAG TPA: hypothetical protein VF622_17930 [Segetibacter sp.]|jgi:hypothetical protein
MKLQDFIIELFQRFALKSPKFYQKLQTVGLVALGIGFVPEILELLEITVTGQVAKYIGLAVKVAGAFTWLLAKTPVIEATSEQKYNPHIETKVLPYSGKEVVVK